MPLFHEKTLENNSHIAIWKITEDEQFFRQKVNISREISHPRKRLQHLAGRYLLQYLAPTLPLSELLINANGKPYHQFNNLHFSISHCADFAGVIISKNAPVGIDLEVINPKLTLLRHKFLAEQEKDLLEKDHRPGSELALLTLAWSAKEAIFKWYGEGKVDFKRHMKLQAIDLSKNLISATFEKDRSQLLMLQYQFFNELCIVWTTENQV